MYLFRWFIHFYAFGLTWNVYLLVTFLQSCTQDDPSLQGFLRLLSTIKGNSINSGLDCFSVLFTLSLLTIQLARRLYESLFVSSFSGEMHLGHYVIGLVFYALVNLTIVAEIPTPLQQGMGKQVFQVLINDYCSNLNSILNLMFFYFV